MNKPFCPINLNPTQKSRVIFLYVENFQVHKIEHLFDGFTIFFSGCNTGPFQ